MMTTAPGSLLVKRVGESSGNARHLAVSIVA